MHQYPLLCFLLVAVSHGNPYHRRHTIDTHWDNFKQLHGKQYDFSEEELYRKQVFADNLEKITRHNFLYDLGVHSYKMGINELSDLTSEEFLSLYTVPMLHLPSYGLLLNSSGLPEEEDFSSDYDEDAELLSEIDWRSRGAVTPVKNQGECGSCWAFSTTGAVEAQWFKKTGQLVSLSEQNLVDCSSRFGNYGCGGGWMKLAMDYVRVNHGIDTEAAYPYEARQSRCRYRPDAKGASITNAIVFSGEEEMQQKVANLGPVSVAVEVGVDFQHYSKGVFDNPRCGTQLNHAMLAVGFGSEGGQDYWLIKNSWGSSWGDKGYVKMSRNKNNQCGIASAATFPIV